MDEELRRDEARKINIHAKQILVGLIHKLADCELDQNGQKLKNSLEKLYLVHDSGVNRI